MENLTEVSRAKFGASRALGAGQVRSRHSEEISVAG